MEWSMRLRTAYQIAEALEHCSTADFAFYNNFSAYTVLFDEEEGAQHRQRPPTKQATRVAGSRRSGPRRKHKTTPIQSDEEIQAQNREEHEQMQIRVAQKAKTQLEKPKGKNQMRPSKPGQFTKAKKNQF
ncbi:hypothetical protein ISN44_As07g017140 [Arabidopsis suecica]|uniref:Uncharacterized protein n=1 Tax=Arabidopsis suecica TaxID=45249 RepID=A0A8T2BPV5_ARASU|nr:hypothetical protein ISN44_As07g017140 [Arabidopsis suecica]